MSRLAAFLTPVAVLLTASAAQGMPIEASFRGCESSGWCNFWFERPGESAAALHRVLPDGITPERANEALRDRLNALMADMIHQHKRIELHQLRPMSSGGLSATITVTGLPLMEDAALRQMLQDSVSR